MIISAFPSGPLDTNAYVISCPATHEAVIVDPAVDSSGPIVYYLEKQKLVPKAIWLTHSHWDHIAEVSVLKDKYNIPVAIHSADAPNLEKPGSDGLPCWISFPGVKPDLLLQEGQTLKVGQNQFVIIHTPGHSPGCICLYNPEQHVLITGDTLFKGSIGSLALPTAQPERMWNSLEKLSKLPLATKFYPGHGPSSTLQAESWLPNAKKLFDSN